MTCLICPAWSPCIHGDAPVTAQRASPELTTALTSIAKLPVAPKAKINIRAKGANGEREVAKALNAIIQKCMQDEGFTPSQVLAAANSVQRNQNQSAVGGNDLSHTFGMSIEVKRQEALAINSWWKQTEAAAKPNNELPVLIYRQNGQKWSVVTLGSLHLPPVSGSQYGSFTCRLEMSWDAFQSWFALWVTRKLQAGELPRGVDA